MIGLYNTRNNFLITYPDAKVASRGLIYCLNLLCRAEYCNTILGTPDDSSRLSEIASQYFVGDAARTDII